MNLLTQLTLSLEACKGHPRVAWMGEEKLRSPAARQLVALQASVETPKFKFSMRVLGWGLGGRGVWELKLGWSPWEIYLFLSHIRNFTRNFYLDEITNRSIPCTTVKCRFESRFENRTSSSVNWGPRQTYSLLRLRWWAMSSLREMVAGPGLSPTN